MPNHVVRNFPLAPFSPLFVHTLVVAGQQKAVQGGGGTGNRQANPCKSLVHIEPRSAADLQLLFKGVECCEASLSQPKQQQRRRRRRRRRRRWQPNTRRRIGFGCVYYTKSVQPRRQCRRLLLASLVAMVYTVWWLLLIPTVVVCMYYWVYRRRGGAGAQWRHASLYDRRSRRHCRRRPAQRAPFPPPPPLFRFCVWPTRRIETGGRCDSILDGTVALLAFAGMVVSSWLTLSTSNSASIYSS